MSERENKSQSNVPPLKEVNVKVADTDVCMKAVLLSENDERYVLKFTDGTERSFSKEFSVPGNKVGNLEFLTVNAEKDANRFQSGKRMSSGELRLIRNDAETGQTLDPNDLSRKRSAGYKLQTILDGKIFEERQVGTSDTQNKGPNNERIQSPRRDRSSSEDSKPPRKRRAVGKRTRKKRKVTDSPESSPFQPPEHITHFQTISPPIGSISPQQQIYGQQTGALMLTNKQQRVNTEISQGINTNRFAESNVHAVPGHLPESDRNRIDNILPTVRILSDDMSASVLLQRNPSVPVVNQNEVYGVNIRQEPDSGRHIQRQDMNAAIDMKQGLNSANAVIKEVAADKQWMFCPSKRFMVLFVLIIVCVYCIEQKAKEHKNQELLANSKVLDILGAVYISFFVIAIIAPSSKCITSCCNALALVYLFLLNYILLRFVVLKNQKWNEDSLNIVIPCIMQLLYSILGIYYHSNGNSLSGAIHRVFILISPFVVSLPTIGSLHCQAFYEWFTIYSGCTIYCVGLFIWIYTKSEFRRVKSSNKETLHSQRQMRLIIPRIVKCRHPHYLGIIFMNIGCSMIACSIWSIVTPLLVTIFLTANANKWDNYYRSLDYVGWNNFERQVPHSIFPFHF